jgi:hypothetical protein
MSSANCPFSIFPKKEDPDSMRRKDRYVSIGIPLDPNDPNSQKITHEYPKLNSTEVEAVLEFFSTFDDILKTLALPRGLQRFRLIPAMIGHDAQKKWLDIVTNHATNQTQEKLEDCIERFLLLFMEEDISLDIRNGCLRSKNLEICLLKTLSSKSVIGTTLLIIHRFLIQ